MTQSPALPLPSPKERRRLRESRSLSQAELAALVGVTRETVRSWESGRTDPRGRRREAYARLLATFATEHAPRTPRASRPRKRPKAQRPKSPPTPRPVPVPEPVPEPEPPGEASPPATPEAAFDALCARTAPVLVRQAYALTGHRALAAESVERAFQLAWQRWPEVARDRDPAGWIRSAAHEYALSPWHRFRPRLRQPDAPPADAAHRDVLDALLALPPARRRTVLLYDGVGLDLPETAAETEASTPTAAARLTHARTALAERLPDLADRPDCLHQRLDDLGRAVDLVPPQPAAVRAGSERRARLWTRAAIAFTTLIIGATALTVRTAPTHYEPPQAPGRAISGVPPRMGPGPLTDQDQSLRQKLRSEPHQGPERLTPQPR
ncbi:helix-turn-helix domain-containing protein [Streptomyces sp. G45]|uniref:helix-turn-helix domain-containing protein n=1 Tax=Streptomyces sp. G45 TaxID=3406627 RepID=UPI003C1984A0